MPLLKAAQVYTTHLSLKDLATSPDVSAVLDWLVDEPQRTKFKMLAYIHVEVGGPHEVDPIASVKLLLFPYRYDREAKRVVLGEGLPRVVYFNNDAAVDMLDPADRARAEEWALLSEDAGYIPDAALQVRQLGELEAILNLVSFWVLPHAQHSLPHLCRILPNVHVKPHACLFRDGDLPRDGIYAENLVQVARHFDAQICSSWDRFCVGIKLLMLPRAGNVGLVLDSIVASAATPLVRIKTKPPFDAKEHFKHRHYVWEAPYWTTRVPRADVEVERRFIEDMGNLYNASIPVLEEDLSFTERWM